MTGLGLGITFSIKWVGLFTIAWVGALTLLQLWILWGDSKTVTIVSSGTNPFALCFDGQLTFSSSASLPNTSWHVFSV